MSSPKDQKVALTPAEFAAAFGKSQTWGYRQLYSGKVKAMTGYGRILIPASEVDRLLSEAGRYLGKDVAVERAVPAPKSKTSKKNQRRENPWKSSLRTRKQSTRSSSSKRRARNQSVLDRVHRSTAFRKILAKAQQSEAE